jgi:hypothetical protein
MSMEIYVLSDQCLASMVAWQQAINAEGFDLALDHSRPFDKLRGHLPGTWQGRAAGFECDHWEPAVMFDEYTEIKFDHRWKYCLAFRWGADIRACLGAYMAAAAYANATGGVVFDPDSGKILSPQQAKEAAAEIEKELPAIEQAMQLALTKIKQRHRPSS